VPSVERTESPYLQIARHIREQIKSGQLKDGDLVPSAREITRTWGVAIATASKALATLRSEGLTRAVDGVGTVVQTKGALHHSARDRSIAIHRTGKIYPPGHYAKIRSAELSPASALVADALGIQEGAPAIRRQRTTYTADDIPVSTSVSWFDGALAATAPLLLSTERVIQGTARYVEEQTGRRSVATYVQHAAGFADADESAELGVNEGSAVLVSRNRFVDDNGVVLEYGESTALPDHWVFYEYTTEGTNEASSQR
jgi:DNA-binding GntR family transcriptional regulator